MDSARGTRWMTTFKKLPMMAPTTPTAVAIMYTGRPVVVSSVTNL